MYQIDYGTGILEQVNCFFFPIMFGHTDGVIANRFVVGTHCNAAASIAIYRWVF